MGCAFSRVMYTALENGYPSEARTPRFGDYVRTIHFRMWMEQHGPEQLTLAQAAVLYLNTTSWEGSVKHILSYTRESFNGDGSISFNRFMQRIRMPDKRYLEGVVNLPGKPPFPEMLSPLVRPDKYQRLLDLLTDCKYDPAEDIAHMVSKNKVKTKKGKPRKPQQDLLTFRAFKEKSTHNTPPG